MPALKEKIGLYVVSTHELRLEKKTLYLFQIYKNSTDYFIQMFRLRNYCELTEDDIRIQLYLLINKKYFESMKRFEDTMLVILLIVNMRTV